MNLMPQKRTKYGNTPNTVNGVKCDSLLERSVYLTLLAVYDGSNITRGTKLQIVPGKPGILPVCYMPDFIIASNGNFTYVEVKGKFNPVGLLKLKLFLLSRDNVDLILVGPTAMKRPAYLNKYFVAIESLQAFLINKKRTDNQT